ncbi:hypothetical protein HY486_03940 [Candidatus Woesearchaeota archaeon]|nr:hypothetical protein [Candidatus Woesearchaeota archaeon]
MSKLPNEEFHRLVPLLREKDFYEPEPKRDISWPEYNKTQIQEVKETLTFIQEIVDKTENLNRIGKAGKPLTDAKILTKAILISEAFSFTERASEGWLEILGPIVGIYEHVDERTIGDAYNKIEVLYLLKQIFEDTKNSDGKLAGDGTGLETSRKQNYETNKKTGEYMTSIVDSREIVQAFDISGTQECQIMHKLITQVKGNSLRLDAGFNDRELTKKIVELRMIPYIFPKKNNILNGSPTWKNMYLCLLLDVTQWLTEYHQRSHSESFHSSFKQCFGQVTKRRPTCIISQVTARIILHNRKRLSYFSKLANAS